MYCVDLALSESSMFGSLGGGLALLGGTNGTLCYLVSDPHKHFTSYKII